MIKKIDHIGIAVKNLKDTLRMYKDVYGLSPVKTETFADMNVRIAFIPLGEVLVELLEPTVPGAGRIGKFIQEKGEGFHHIAFRVEDVDRAIEDLKEIRIPLRDQKARKGGGDSRIAFIEPAYTQNVLTELVQRKREVKGG